MKSWRIFLSALPLLVAAQILALAPASALAQTSDRGIPIIIGADNMTYDPDNNKVLFSGAVELKREELTVWCDNLTLFLKESRAGQAESEAAGQLAQSNLNPGELESIVAERNVRFTLNNSSGKSDKVTYDLDRGVLLMEGNPSLRDGDNSIAGRVIRYYLAENRSEVEGGQGQRVQAVFGSSPL